MTSSVWLLISQNGNWFTEIYWWYDLEIWWWLHSTKGSYGRHEIEAAYGETVISLHRDCLGDVSSGRVVGVSTWYITHGRHSRVNTSVGTIYVFSIFNTNSIRFMFWKSICIMKKTLVVLDVVLARRRLENIFDRSWCFLQRNGNLQIYHYCFFKTKIEPHTYFTFCWHVFAQWHAGLVVLFMVGL